jgi:NAD(P)-dependent dehydrogenase (short-subunit alcohol dehydrogenase family)
MAKRRQLTADGVEMDFGVNHVGHFLAATLLLPLLNTSAQSRTVVVSSNMHASRRTGCRAADFSSQRKSANDLP